MELNSNLQHYIAWFKAHERLVVIVLALLFAVHFTGKAYDYLVKHEQTQALIANYKAQTDAKSFATSEQHSEALLQELGAMRQQLQLTNQRIDQVMQQRAAQTIQQKKQNDQAAPPELAARLRTLVGVGNISVSTPLGDGLVFSLDAAHKVADDEEDLSQAHADVKDLNTKLVACQTITDEQADTINGLNGTIGSGKTALTSEQDAHKKDVNRLEGEKKKAWLNGFKWGAITGFLGSLFVHKP